MPRPPLVYDRRLDAPPDLVWNAWTQGAALAEWLALDASVDPVPGGPFELFWNLDDRTVDCTAGCAFRTVEPGHAFTADWRGPTRHPVMDTDTVLELMLEAGPDDSTYLTLVHAGWGASDPWAAARRWQNDAWQHALDSLATHLSGGAGPDIYTVVFHRVGPAWKLGVPFQEQPGVRDHIAHMAELHAEGKLVMGGPFLVDDTGGMVVFDGDAEAARAWCERDPAVQRGLLHIELRPWLVPMRR